MNAFNMDVELSKQEDGLWQATVPGLRGCWVDAPSLEQAFDEIQDVATMVIVVMEEKHEVLPPSVSPADEVSFSARIPVLVREHPFVRRSPRRTKPLRVGGLSGAQAAIEVAQF
jgi:predicted RNase H-like HicB family nuclease